MSGSTPRNSYLVIGQHVLVLSRNENIKINTEVVFCQFASMWIVIFELVGSALPVAHCLKMPVFLKPLE